MALESQNGWPASANKRDINVRTFKIGNTSFIGGVRHGDVETVMRYVAEQFNDRVERFVNPGCWGWAFREIRGGNSYSNHASGTAIDFNAPRHPLGVEGTFTAEQRAIGASILDSVDNVVRWGEFYRGRVDGMHLEIDANADKIHEIAERIRNVPLSESEILAVADAVLNRSVEFTDPAGNKHAVTLQNGVLNLYAAMFYGGESMSNGRSIVRHLEDLEALLIAEGDMPTEMLAAITRLSNSINAAIEKANGTVD